MNKLKGYIKITPFMTAASYFTLGSLFAGAVLTVCYWLSLIDQQGYNALSGLATICPLLYAVYMIVVVTKNEDNG